MSILRIKAVILQSLYNLKHSLEDIVETFFWPFIDVVLWGFITVYLTGLQRGRGSDVVVFLLGGLILWNIVYRAQQDIGFAFLRNVWSRNILNLFSSPLSPWEFMFATMALGLVKILLTLAVVSLAAFAFYSFNIFSLGFYFLPFFVSLILFAWAVGIFITGLIIRFGMRIQAFVWSLVFLIYPISAVFYPVEVLPPFLQKVALLLPTAHIFEGMREVLATGTLSGSNLIWAFSLDIVYMLLAAWFFVIMFEKAREKGKLAKAEM